MILQKGVATAQGYLKNPTQLENVIEEAAETLQRSLQQQQVC